MVIAPLTIEYRDVVRGDDRPAPTPSFLIKAHRPIFVRFYAEADVMDIGQSRETSDVPKLSPSLETPARNIQPPLILGGIACAKERIRFDHFIRIA
jgi:hypothetical protein